MWRRFLLVGLSIASCRGFGTPRATRREALVQAGWGLGLGLVAPATASAGVFEELDEKAKTQLATREGKTGVVGSADGVDNKSSALIQDLLEKTEANRAVRKRALDIEMFEKSQGGLYGPGRRNFAVVDESGAYKIINEFEFERLQKAGRITPDRSLLPDPNAPKVDKKPEPVEEAAGSVSLPTVLDDDDDL